jgi:tetratricopeptide (TPR) repeat protein
MKQRTRGFSGILLAALLLCAAVVFAAASAGAQEAAPELVSPLGRKLYAEPATGEALQKLEAALQEAAAKLEGDPQNADLLIAQGRALAGLWRYREAIEVYTKGIALHPENALLYRHRGHRYISTRLFDKAAADLEKADALLPNDYDILYHLGLAYYLRGEFEASLPAYERCLAAAKDDGSRIAISNWYHHALRRAGKKAEAEKILAAITPNMNAGENASYLNLLLFYKGMKSEEELLKAAEATPLELATTGYGVGAWYLYTGAPDKAKALFERVVATPYWPAFGFIGAEAELVRLKSGR